MSRSVQILPSDKNEVEYFVDVSPDGQFEISLPLTDGNRRDRKLTLVHFQTQSPFIPGAVQEFYDASEKEGGIGTNQRFYMLQIDVDKIFNTTIVKNAADLLKNQKWKRYNDVMDLYRESPDDGLLVNTDYVNAVMTNFWNNSVDDDMDLNNYVQVFAEMGTKVTESELNDQSNPFDINIIKPDQMKMFLFPLNFYYPLITQIDHGASGTELDVGTVPSLNYDANLRSMLRYALVDLNKGDIRSAFTESHRSAYLEYDVKDPNVPDKVETKYIFAWTLGNPIFYDLQKQKPENGFMFRFILLKNNANKRFKYGRLGSYVNMVGVNDEGVRGEMNNTYLKDFFMDLGYNMTATSIYDTNKENCLMNIFRCNWGFVFSGAFRFFVQNQNMTLEMPSVIKDIKTKLSSFDNYQIYGRNIFALFTGDLDIIKSWISNIRTISVFNRPSNISFYGSDLVLRLMCDQVQTIVSGDQKRKTRLANVLATLVANEQTYQSFNGVDNRIVFQPPTFRPLLFLASEQSLIVGSSSRRLTFYILNADNEPVKFAPGERAYIRFKIEVVH